jgi:hypothetical protein
LARITRIFVSHKEAQKDFTAKHAENAEIFTTKTPYFAEAATQGRQGTKDFFLLLPFYF